MAVPFQVEGIMKVSDAALEAFAAAAWLSRDAEEAEARAKEARFRAEQVEAVARLWEGNHARQS